MFSQFRRITTSQRFIPEIDGLRFVAIGLVLLFHVLIGLSMKVPSVYGTVAYGNVLGVLAHQGFYGVHLFFVISGFILAVPFANQYLRHGPPVRLRQYFLRRLTRLEPPYILSMLIFFTMMVVLQGGDVRELLPHLGASLLYLHNIIYRWDSIINIVAWSLEIEVQFYILVPLLASLFLIRRKAVRRWTIAACAFGAIMLQLTVFSDFLYTLTIIHYLQFFLTGFLLADVYLNDWLNNSPQAATGTGAAGQTADMPNRPLIKKTFGWDLVAIAGWPLLVVLWAFPKAGGIIHSEFVWGILFNLIFPAMIFILYVAAFRGRLTNVIFTHPLITTIGGMCYSIYLLHNRIIGFFMNHFTYKLSIGENFTINFLMQALLLIPTAIALSAVFFLLIEKPCMRKDWPQRLWNRLQTLRIKSIPVAGIRPIPDIIPKAAPDVKRGDSAPSYPPGQHAET